MARDLAASLRAYLVAGLFGGSIVYLISAVDRVVTLWPSFNSPVEPLVFALYLAPIVPLGLAVGAALGLVLLAVRAVFLGAAWLVARVDRSPRFAPWIAGGVTVLALGLAIRAFLAARPELVETPLFKLVRKIDGKLVSIDPIVSSFPTLFLAAIFLGVAALLVADVVLGYRAGRGWRVPRALGAGLFAAGAAAMYLLDSRFLYGRYESTIHVPAALGALVLAFVAAGLARGIVAASPGGRRLVSRAMFMRSMQKISMSFLEICSSARFERVRARTSSRARTVAERGWMSRRCISPNACPGPSSASFFSP